MSGGHLRPLAATRVAARGCKWLPVTRECWRPLAATCGHSSGCKWLQVAASGCRWQENAGGHLRPLAATRVAASGCHFQNQITRLLRAQCENTKQWVQKVMPLIPSIVLAGISPRPFCDTFRPLLVTVVARWDSSTSFPHRLRGQSVNQLTVPTNLRAKPSYPSVKSHGIP